ncbi:MAG: hypothetical protein U0936_20710 [Planctomycetaceae bacterium]
MQSKGNSEKVSIAIIGRSHASEFRGLFRQIQNSPDLQVTGQFDSIEEALAGGIHERLSAEIVVVLQAFSDEYSPADAGRLIGRMLFRRVLCCYGPWCLSDGRTHEIWPAVVRVSVASAWKVLSREIRNVREGVPTLLPMAAAEEVFADRADVEFDENPGHYDAILIASDDRTLRETIAEMLRHTASQVFECGTSMRQIQRALSVLIPADVVHSRISVLLDIDGQENQESELSRLIRSAFPSSHLLRLTSFPQAVPEGVMFDRVIDKLEISTQLLAR